MIRCLPWRHIFSPEGIVLPTVDPYYHLRRAQLIIEHWPSIPSFDAWLSFPGGGTIPWPPGFDLLLALPSIIAGQRAPFEAWAALLMPLLGGLSVYLTWRLGRRIFDRPTGLVASLIVATMFGAVSISFLGRADHHGLVAPVTLACFLAFLASLRSRNAHRNWLWGVGCGLAAAFSLASWIVTPALYFLPVPIACAWLSILSPGRWRRPALASLLSAAVLCATLAALLTKPDRPFDLYHASWMHAALFAALAGWGLLSTWRPRIALLTAGIGLAGLIGICLAWPDTGPIGEMLSVVSGRSADYHMVGESSPLFIHEFRFAPWHPAHLYTYFIFICPFIWAALAWQSRRRADPGRLLLVLFAGLGIVLLWLQQRFGEYAAPALALLYAWAIVAGARAARQQIIGSRTTGARIRAWVLACALSISILAAASPLLSSNLDFASRDPASWQRSLVRFGHELAEIAPPEITPAGLPRTGMLTGWRDAHPLLWASGWPVSASSFASDRARAGNRASFAAMLSADEQAVITFMEKARLRFLIVSPIMDEVQQMAELAGIDTEYLQIRDDYTQAEPIRHVRSLPPFTQAVHTRALIADGSAALPDGRPMEGLSHFRLLLESKTGVDYLGVRVAAVKAFERVAGARMEGNAEPGQLIQLRLAVETNAGRRFTYRQSCVADAQGRYCMCVPYPTSGGPWPCTARGPYRIKVGERVQRVEVVEQDVRLGRLVPVANP
ncbi:MAG: glycosyltransferase family 39 protein [Deltaproteobacteria bacterium]|nr:glycosyltransferase family 39 protein [Deltaproteobacteria bacterium]